MGNVGTGKSTLARKYVNKGYIVIARDSLRYMIGGGKYIFNLDLEKAIWDSELAILNQFMRMGVKILIDEIGISKEMRERYIDMAKIYDYHITVIELPKLSKKECIKRKRNVPHDQPNDELWGQVWEKFDKQYEKPTLKEGINKIIRLRSKK